MWLHQKRIKRKKSFSEWKNIFRSKIFGKNFFQILKWERVLWFIDFLKWTYQLQELLQTFIYLLNGVIVYPMTLLWADCLTLIQLSVGSECYLYSNHSAVCCIFQPASGACSTWKLVKLLFSAIFNHFCSFFTFFNIKGWKRMKKSSLTSFQVLQAM